MKKGKQAYLSEDGCPATAMARVRLYDKKREGRSRGMSVWEWAVVLGGGGG